MATSPPLTQNRTNASQHAQICPTTGRSSPTGIRNQSRCETRSRIILLVLQCHHQIALTFLDRYKIAFEKTRAITEVMVLPSWTVESSYKECNYACFTWSHFPLWPTIALTVQRIPSHLFVSKLFAFLQQYGLQLLLHSDCCSYPSLDCCLSPDTFSSQGCRLQ